MTDPLDYEPGHTVVVIDDARGLLHVGSQYVCVSSTGVAAPLGCNRSPDCRAPGVEMAGLPLIDNLFWCGCHFRRYQGPSSAIEREEYYEKVVKKGEEIPV
jgi:hypothetical protein